MGAVMEGLTVGRIVHYVLESGRSKGEHRPAIVVRDWSNPELPGSDGMVQLQVFTDGGNDGLETSFPVNNGLAGSYTRQTDLMIWRTSVHYDIHLAPGTWHWPERV